MYLASWDSIGTVVSCMMIIIASLTQIPKRLIWRYRPFMVSRARGYGREQTSSFPSRAVTCAVSYSMTICLCIMRTPNNVQDFRDRWEWCAVPTSLRQYKRVLEYLSRYGIR